jgi:hypothetical protein
VSPKKDDGKAKEVAYPGDPDGFMAEQKDQQDSTEAKPLDEDAAVKKIEEMSGPDAKFGAQPDQYGDGEDGFGAMPAQYGNPDEVQKKAGE